MKIPRHIRIAYLIKLMQLRIISGRNAKYAWKRQNILVKELNKEDSMMNLKGFMINGRVVKAA